MTFFQEPNHTRFDLRFNFFGTPARVHPLFWLMTLLFGASSGSLPGLVIWIVIVFISILIHELGHALTMRFFGQPARVVLYFGGGLASPDSWGNGSALTANEQIIMLLAGPGAGFLLAGLTLGGVVAAGGTIDTALLFGVIPFPVLTSLPVGGWLAVEIVETILWVNIFWGIINLMPVYPLDGGQVTRHLWIKADRWDGARKSLWLSVIVGAGIAVAGLTIIHSTYLGILFGLLAFQSYQALQQTR